MSYSRTYGYSRGGYSAGYSRGTNAARNDMGRGSSGEQFDADQQEQQPHGAHGQTETTSRVQRSVGFTMFRPDEKKRAQLEQVANREIEEADARREARRLQRIHERPRRVGGEMNHSSAIMQKQKAVTAATTGLEIQKKREKWQREKREAEEKEHREKKEKARAQAERNEVLRAVRAQELEERHRDAHRRRNQAFLDRLETRNTYNGY